MCNKLIKNNTWISAGDGSQNGILCGVRLSVRKLWPTMKQATTVAIQIILHSSLKIFLIS